MRWWKALLGMVLLAGIIGALAAAVLVGLPYGPHSETFVDLQPGIGTAGIAAALKRGGIIRSSRVFEAMKLWKGGSLKAGVYRFDHAATPAEVYDRLRSGDVYTRTVVIPEGFNIFDIADAVAAAGLGSREAFLQAETTDTNLIAALLPQGAVISRPASLEGYLFPDTYRFSPHATPAQMLSAMVRNFARKTQALGSGVELRRALVLASLVEKEVHRDDERAEVAGVFENRLAADMPLQTDPSVVYASLLRGTWLGVIHQSELHSSSAWNTYIRRGLPPGPICNPGLASLQAALHPAVTPYLYFVAGPDGTPTRFARTLPEHEANVALYRASHR